MKPSYPWLFLSPKQLTGGCRDLCHALRAPRVEGAAWNPLRELKDEDWPDMMIIDYQNGDYTLWLCQNSY